MSPIPFAKGEALGNDYLVVRADAIGADGARAAGDPSRALSVDQCRALCDRHRGAGADGVLVVWPERSPIRLRIWNPDGSIAEKSGNGLRIAAAWLHHRGHVRTGEPFDVELATDTVRMTVHGERDGERDVSVEMGRARFLADEAGETLDVNGEGVTVHAVSLGNPHCVVIEKALDRSRFDRIGPRLEWHPRFPAGTNVQFAAARDRSSVEMLIHERGVGETSASGSSSCAVAAVAKRLGLVDGPDVTVHMPGGALQVRVGPDYAVHLRGPARLVYEGSFLV
ncbi:MAG TPA: diaminopimelate epimerase [Longimicrobiales bacterium]|nr:diaminopimelate epimerase [Longimicrobiales bacterium]